MENNTQLPVEVVEEIKEKAKLSADFLSNDEHVVADHIRGYEQGWGEGATAYATKLHELETHSGLLKTEIRHLNTVIEKLQQENDRLTVELQTAIDAYEVHKNAVVHYKNTKQILQQENEKMKEQATGWRPLLEEVISKHNTGKLPDHNIYEKIKKFLYGE